MQTGFPVAHTQPRPFHQNPHTGSGAYGIKNLQGSWHDDCYNDDNVLLYLPGQNANNATTFYDLSNNRRTVITVSTAVHSTDRIQGWSSIKLQSTGYLTLASDTDWNFGTDSFTFEFWLYYPGQSDGVLLPLISRAYSSSLNWVFGILRTGSSYAWTFWYESSSGVYDIDLSFASNPSLAGSKWYYVSLTRDGSGNWYMHQSDGYTHNYYLGTPVTMYLCGSVENDTSSLGVTSNVLAIGAGYNKANSYVTAANAYLSGLVITASAKYATGDTWTFNGFSPDSVTWSARYTADAVSLFNSKGQVMTCKDMDERVSFCRCGEGGYVQGTSLTVNTWYKVWAVSAGDKVRLMLTSLTGTVPKEYEFTRHISYLLVGDSSLYPFRQIDQYWQFLNQQQIRGDGAGPTSWVAGTEIINDAATGTLYWVPNDGKIRMAQMSSSFTVDGATTSERYMYHGIYDSIWLDYHEQFYSICYYTASPAITYILSNSEFWVPIFYNSSGYPVFAHYATSNSGPYVNLYCRGFMVPL